MLVPSSTSYATTKLILEKSSIYLFLYINGIIWGVGFGCDMENIDQGRSYSDINIDISHCFFLRSSSYSNSGGVVYVSAGSYSMSINETMFYNCICSNYGGAIYFDSTNSSLRMICANRCSAPNDHFAYLSTSQMNHVEYLSVSNCSQTTSGYSSICIDSGDQRLENSNSSMNNAFRRSGIEINSPSSSTNSHCTFSNNEVSDSICIYLYSTTETISMSYANIVHNNSPSSKGVVTVWGGGLRKMMYCIFYNNQNTLFCVWSGSLEVSHSFIDHSETFSTSTAVSTSDNNSLTNIMTYQLQFFNSLFCNADIPLNDKTLKNTPDETLMNTHEETIMHTPDKTLINTPQETLMDTPQETPKISSQEINKNSSSVIIIMVGIVTLSIIVLIISLAYGFLFIQDSKPEISNKSSSQSDGHVSDPIKPNNI